MGFWLDKLQLHQVKVAPVDAEVPSKGDRRAAEPSRPRKSRGKPKGRSNRKDKSTVVEGEVSPPRSSRVKSSGKDKDGRSRSRRSKSKSKSRSKSQARIDDSDPTTPRRFVVELNGQGTVSQVFELSTQTLQTDNTSSAKRAESKPRRRSKSRGRPKKDRTAQQADQSPPPPTRHVDQSSSCGSLPPPPPRSAAPLVEQHVSFSTAEPSASDRTSRLTSRRRRYQHLSEKQRRLGALSSSWTAPASSPSVLESSQSRSRSWHPGTQQAGQILHEVDPTMHLTLDSSAIDSRMGANDGSPSTSVVSESISSTLAVRESLSSDAKTHGSTLLRRRQLPSPSKSWTARGLPTSLRAELVEGSRPLSSSWTGPRQTEHLSDLLGALGVDPSVTPGETPETPQAAGHLRRLSSSACSGSICPDEDGDWEVDSAVAVTDRRVSKSPCGLFGLSSATAPGNADQDDLYDSTLAVVHPQEYCPILNDETNGLEDVAEGSKAGSSSPCIGMKE